MVETATGHLGGTYDLGDTSSGLYWLGGTEARPFVVSLGYGCGSTGPQTCGVELYVSGSGDATDFGGSSLGPAVKEGVVLIYDPTSIEVYHDDNHDIAIDLPKMPRSARFEVVADVAHDRLFAISSGGLVAEIDHVANRWKVTYHPVELNGQPFRATWAGAGRIALWGPDGLGMIDTRTWTTQPVATAVTHALATPLGLAAWDDDPTAGLSVYRPDGSRRLQVLAGKPMGAVTALGHYLYVRAHGQYSVDLRNGRVSGPLRTPARVVTPTLVAIP